MSYLGSLDLNRDKFTLDMATSFVREDGLLGRLLVTLHSLRLRGFSSRTFQNFPYKSLAPADLFLTFVKRRAARDTRCGAYGSGQKSQLPLEMAMKMNKHHCFESSCGCLGTRLVGSVFSLRGYRR